MNKNQTYTPKWYNTIEGVARHCNKLEDFNKLLEARKDAVVFNSTHQGEILNKFLIKGETILNENGTVSQLTECMDATSNKKIDLSFLSGLPDVIYFSVFLHKIEEMSKPKIMYSVKSHSQTPETGHRCHFCGQRWTMDTIHDYILTGADVVYRDNLFEKIGCIEMDEIAEKAAGNRYVYNRLLSQALSTIFQTDELDEDGYFLNGRMYKFAHHACWTKVNTNQSREEFVEAFTQSGLMIHGSIRVPNEFGSELTKGAWFKFDTDVGMIKVGWREYDIVIDYTEIDPDYISTFGSISEPGLDYADSLDNLTKSLTSFLEHRGFKIMPSTETINLK